MVMCEGTRSLAELVMRSRYVRKSADFSPSLPRGLMFLRSGYLRKSADFPPSLPSGQWISKKE